MDPFLRISIAIAALAAPGFLLAAPGDPPPAGGLDLGAMKLKKATTPAQNAVGAAPAAAPTTALPAVQRQPANAPVTVTPPAGATQQNTQAANQPAATNPANQTGVGTVVGTAPIGRRSASEILGQTSNNQQQQQSSGDVQVKLPSMFKKVNP